MSAETDEPRPQPQYDEEEAREILAGYLELQEHASTSSDRTLAAARLIAETAALCRELGFTVNSDSEGLELRFRRSPNFAYAWYAEGGFTTGAANPNQQRAPERKPLLVRFNRFTKQFEGVEDDAYRVPIPGQPRAKRAAKAVLAEALVAALKEDLPK